MFQNPMGQTLNKPSHPPCQSYWTANTRSYTKVDMVYCFQIWRFCRNSCPTLLLLSTIFLKYLNPHHSIFRIQHLRQDAMCCAATCSWHFFTKAAVCEGSSSLEHPKVFVKSFSTSWREKYIHKSESLTKMGFLGETHGALLLCC